MSNLKNKQLVLILLLGNYLTLLSTVGRGPIFKITTAVVLVLALILAGQILTIQRKPTTK
ncbi:hypothetical protein [Lacticaseibacillus brantae]|uniref:Uncharacterized protein n=1 Tax=Lacticaseibacillus brantae DSM 23927 TaxID=1423727 RepID=A0A0R2B736_9LACO|nr:hypothetical protein [Lacticaseibacillus brantae]KRM72105.1 hypothetical protein FC34_GL001089 [Lacticaseibacillus brantae DSM 23927]